jgi:hypothetical protein
MREDMRQRESAAASASRAVDRAAGVALPASKSWVQGVVGISVMPPSNPFGGRERTSTQPSARTATKAAPRRIRPARFRALRGNVSGSPRRRAAHTFNHGQAVQAGRLGVQMVALKSISPWAKSPARRLGTRPAASFRSCGFPVGNSCSKANSLATTRSTLPSTAAARTPKAIAAIAAAV